MDTSNKGIATSSFLLLVVMPLLLEAMPLLLVAMHLLLVRFQECQNAGFPFPSFPHLALKRAREEEKHIAQPKIPKANE